MAENHTVRKIWAESFEIILRNPVIMLPFFVIAFLEGLALELIYFSTRKPFLPVTAPILKKFFGEAFLHYPLNLASAPKLFLYFQVLIYIFAGVFLSAISINIIKNIEAGLPLKAKALIKNAVKKYLAFIVFGFISAILIFLLGRVNTFIFPKIAHLISRYLPAVTPKMQFLGFVAPISFLLNLIVETFLLLTLPILIIRKSTLIKALWGSISMGGRNFFRIFSLIFLPYALYLPVSLLKTYSPRLIDKTFPEITLIVIGAGIIISIFVTCYVVVCASMFLLKMDKT